MSRHTMRLLDPIPWRPDLAGAYPGQQSVIELVKQGTAGAN